MSTNIHWAEGTTVDWETLQRRAARAQTPKTIAIAVEQVPSTDNPSGVSTKEYKVRMEMFFKNPPKGWGRYGLDLDNEGKERVLSWNSPNVGKKDQECFVSKSAYAILAKAEHVYNRLIGKVQGEYPYPNLSEGSYTEPALVGKASEENVDLGKGKALFVSIQKMVSMNPNIKQKEPKRWAEIIVKFSSSEQALAGFDKVIASLSVLREAGVQQKDFEDKIGIYKHHLELEVSSLKIVTPKG